MAFDTAGIEQLLREIAAILERQLPPGPDPSAIPANAHACPASALQNFHAMPDTSIPGSLHKAQPSNTKGRSKQSDLDLEPSWSANHSIHPNQENLEPPGSQPLQPLWWDNPLALDPNADPSASVQISRTDILRMSTALVAMIEQNVGSRRRSISHSPKTGAQDQSGAAEGIETDRHDSVRTEGNICDGHEARSSSQLRTCKQGSILNNTRRKGQLNSKSHNLDPGSPGVPIDSASHMTTHTLDSSAQAFSRISQAAEHDIFQIEDELATAEQICTDSPASIRADQQQCIDSRTRAVAATDSPVGTHTGFTFVAGCQHSCPPQLQLPLSSAAEAPGPMDTGKGSRRDCASGRTVLADVMNSRQQNPPTQHVADEHQKQQQTVQPKKANNSRLRAGRRKRGSSQPHSTPSSLPHQPTASPFLVASGIPSWQRTTSPTANAQQSNADEGALSAGNEAYPSPASTVPADQYLALSDYQPVWRVHGEAPTCFSLQAAANSLEAEGHIASQHVFPFGMPDGDSHLDRTLADCVTPFSVKLASVLSPPGARILTGATYTSHSANTGPWHEDGVSAGAGIQSESWPRNLALPGSPSIPGMRLVPRSLDGLANSSDAAGAFALQGSPCTNSQASTPLPHEPARDMPQHAAPIGHLANVLAHLREQDSARASSASKSRLHSRLCPSPLASVLQRLTLEEQEESSFKFQASSQCIP
ncbi:hypothetical protein WJX74_005704 [Apatococcus lobatus]|uniref:Uncharacterized protein n=1 Tax=Apatococcus lobatus TaxID=904363 RepID=A0AAW1QYL8_9CHLO